MGKHINALVTCTKLFDSIMMIMHGDDEDFDDSESIRKPWFLAADSLSHHFYANDLGQRSGTIHQMAGS